MATAGDFFTYIVLLLLLVIIGPTVICWWTWKECRNRRHRAKHGTDLDGRAYVEVRRGGVLLSRMSYGEVEARNEGQPSGQSA